MIDALGVFRERRYSPGKVEDDAAILDRVAALLRQKGLAVLTVAGEELPGVAVSPRIVFAMCQGPEALARLEAFRCPVVNPPRAIRACYRTNLLRELEAAAIPQPRWRTAGPQFPRDLGPGPWLKRGDVHAMEPGDVRRIFSEGQWRIAVEDFRRRGVSSAIVQEHRDGAVFKFYGVGDGFFRAFGLPPGREAAAADLARAGARALGLTVYGGDGVCGSDGSLALVDMNDWPSFSRCREEAAEAIIAHLLAVAGWATR
jgi:hypothetical protein